MHLVLDELVDVAEGERLLTDAARQYVLVWLASIRVACKHEKQKMRTLVMG